MPSAGVNGALHAACSRGDRTKVLGLLDRGAAINAPFGFDKCTPLIQAIKNNKVGSIQKPQNILHDTPPRTFPSCLPTPAYTSAPGTLPLVRVDCGVRPLLLAQLCQTATTSCRSFTPQILPLSSR